MTKPARAGQPTVKGAAPGSARGGGAFAFGPRRYASKGPRRLFVPQKCQVAPVFELEAERPHALLRTQTSCT